MKAFNFMIVPTIRKNFKITFAIVERIKHRKIYAENVKFPLHTKL